MTIADLRSTTAPTSPGTTVTLASNLAAIALNLTVGRDVIPPAVRRLHWSQHMHTYKSLAVVGLISLLASGSYAQSLGDVARQQREKQAKEGHAAHKVVTNEEIPENPDAVASGTTSVDDHSSSSAPAASNDTHSGEQWKAKIEAQKSTIASMQSEIDRLNSSIHFVEANRYSNGVQYNQRQIQKQEEVQRVQKQLDEQKKKLEEMQEGARKAGLGSSVYDP